MSPLPIDQASDRAHEQLIDQLYEENMPINESIVVTIINSQANIKFITKKEFMKALGEENVDVVRFVLANKILKKHYNNAFICAAKSGHQTIVDLFFEYRVVNINEAFIIVAAHGHINMLEKFIQLGANCFNRALIHTIKSYDKLIPESIYQVIICLVSNGANCFNYALREIKKTQLDDDRFLKKYLIDKEYDMTEFLVQNTRIRN